MAKPPPSKPVQLRRHLFYETSHSPALVDLVGEEDARTITDFCFIANPYYPTPEMMARLSERLPELIKSYPSSNPAIAARRLATVLGVDSGSLIVGNGASELITAVCDLLTSIAVPVPTFGEYIEKIEPTRLSIMPLRADDGYQLDLEVYADWCHRRRAKAALVINPGNPTGQVFPVAEMQEFLRAVEDLEVVIVDESFIDFAGDEAPSLMPTAHSYPNLVLVRSMSKHCGVPGLRLGYCYSGNQDLIDRLRRNLPTWNINTLAEYFLEMLGDTTDEYERSRLAVMRDTQSLYTSIRDMPAFTTHPTGANFILVRIDAPFSARELQLALLSKYRLYVRDCTNKVGMDDRHIRISSQGADADSMLIDALAELADDPPRVRELAALA